MSKRLTCDEQAWEILRAAASTGNDKARVMIVSRALRYREIEALGRAAKAIQADITAARRAWDNPSLADHAFNEGKAVAKRIVADMGKQP